MAYNGPDRRVHKVYITRNTEYHTRRNVCVAVKDRRSGAWLKAHAAMSYELDGSLRFNRKGGVRANTSGKPKVGESLFFYTAGRDLITSPIMSVERPQKKVVKSYPE